MLIEVLKSKIAHATITETQLFYEGSLTIDENLMKAVDLLPGQKIEVLNLNNGERLQTYIIVGKAGSGDVCLNGPAARRGYVGDRIIILAYASMEPEEAKGFEPKVILLDEQNRVKS